MNALVHVLVEGARRSRIGKEVFVKQAVVGWLPAEHSFVLPEAGNDKSDLVFQAQNVLRCQRWAIHNNEGRLTFVLPGKLCVPLQNSMLLPGQRMARFDNFGALL